jgi:hypothetical protein
MSKTNLKRVDDQEILIPLKAGASLLGLSPATIRLGKAGTENLTKIPQGRKLFLIKSEVLKHQQNLIEAGRKSKEALKLVYSSE